MSSNLKRCTACDKVLDIENFQFADAGRRWRVGRCKTCTNQYKQDRRHRLGHSNPASENKDCSLYLGVVVAEEVLSKMFMGVQRMPFGNPGYDFICSKQYKIDAKSGCLHPKPHAEAYQRWTFHIGKNTTADYFLLLAFDNRSNLTPIHVWLVPGEELRDKSKILIYDSPKNLGKWAEYEKPIGKIAVECDRLRHPTVHPN